MVAVGRSGGGKLSPPRVSNEGVDPAPVVLAYAPLRESGLLEPVGQAADRALVEAECLGELGDPHAALLRDRELARPAWR